MFEAVCPNCSKKLEIPEEALGRTVTCKCGAKFRIDSNADAGAAVGVGAASSRSSAVRVVGHFAVSGSVSCCC
jgi:hypothetical protein